MAAQNIFIDCFKLLISQSRPTTTMLQHQSRDNPDPKNILSGDQKQKRQATDCAQGVDSYFRAVEATSKPRQAQG